MQVIDLHVHGLEGLDTTAAGPDTMLRIAELQGRAGVSKMLLSIYPAPIPVMRSRMAAVQEAMQVQQSLSNITHPTSNIENCPPPARILGVHLEGPFLNPSRCGALDPATLLQPDQAVLERLLDGFEQIVRTLTVAPELPGAPALIRSATDRGIIVSMGHSEATYGEAETGFRAGARGITHLFNAMRGFHHREPGMAGFGLINREVYVEVIGDLRHVSAETLGLVFRMKDPARIILVSDAVAGTRAHAGSTPEEEGGKLVGGLLTLPVAAAGLIGRGFQEEAITMAVGTNPLAYLELRGRG